MYALDSRSLFRALEISQPHHLIKNGFDYILSLLSFWDTVIIFPLYVCARMHVCGTCVVLETGSYCVAILLPQSRKKLGLQVCDTTLGFLEWVEN